MNDISTAFHEYFEIVIADTPLLLKEAFSIRYQMLCVNKCMPGFDADSYHDKLEQDEFDSCSLHLLLRHRSSNSFIGTTRLILSGSLGNDKKLPIELYTQFYPANTNMNLPRQQSIEISRFIILNSFLRRKGDNYFMMDKNAELLEGSGRRRFPHPMLGLAIGIIQTCAIHNIYHLFSIMDPALNRLFGFYGMQFYPIGPLVSYHGLRRPFYVCLIDVLERMYENHRDIWELVTNNGKVWPENLEYYKSICGPRQNVSNTDISIINC